MSVTRKWCESDVETLINLVQQKECIYNVRSAEYLNRDAKAQAFNEICQEMANTFNVNEIKRKWKNLRVQYIYTKAVVLLRIEIFGNSHKYERGAKQFRGIF